MTECYNFSQWSYKACNAQPEFSIENLLLNYKDNMTAKSKMQLKLLRATFKSISVESVSIYGKNDRSEAIGEIEFKYHDESVNGTIKVLIFESKKSR